MTDTSQAADDGATAADAGGGVGPRVPAGLVEWWRRRGPAVAIVTALLAASAIGAGMLRRDPVAAMDEPRSVAAAVARAVADGSVEDLSELATARFSRDLDAGRVDVTSLEELSGSEPAAPVLLASGDREIRSVVVLRGERRVRLELVLLRDDSWRVDRIEPY